MAGLSIARRRKAWIQGVVAGASGKGKCLLQLPKLREIFQRGVAHGQANAKTPFVISLLEQEQRRHAPRRKQQPQGGRRQFGRGDRHDRFGGRGGGGGFGGGGHRSGGFNRR